LPTTIAQDPIYSRRFTTRMVLLKRMSNHFAAILTLLIASMRHMNI